MKQFPSTIYKRFLQKQENTAAFQCTTIVAIPNELTIYDLVIFPEHQWQIPPPDTSIILLPLAGTIGVNCVTFSEELSPSQLAFASNFDEKSGRITNPYNNDAVNFLAIQIKKSSFEQRLYTIEFPLFELTHDNFYLAIRKFGNREEYDYHPQKTSSELLIVCLAGAFEFENRLVEDREALRLMAIDKCEMESLIEGSILLFIEQY